MRPLPESGAAGPDADENELARQQAGRAQLQIFFAAARKLNASDIHLHPGMRPVVRVDGRLFNLKGFETISEQEVQAIVSAVLDHRQTAQYRKIHQVDTSAEFEQLGVLRINVYRQRNHPSLAMRLVRYDIPTTQELGIPDILLKLAHFERGLVLLTGATSNGKSTTLAALIEEINLHHAKHILTIEDPIEFIFENKRSIFSQRDIGVDAVSYTGAMIAAMRQDPDVILLSDLRDDETIENALLAAETGHLVFATTHAPTAPDAITRIVATFPPDAQDTLRVKLAQNLRAVVAQRLLPPASGTGRVLAVEYMLVNARIRELMLDPMKIHDIAKLVSSTQLVEGVQSFDAHLARLHNEGRISRETALQHATNETDMRLQLSGLRE